MEPNQPTRGAYADCDRKALAPLIQLNELGIVWGFTPPNTWSYFKPPNLGTLASMVDGKGYWVLVTDPINITIVGYVITPGSPPPTYSLATGWNLIGFKPQPTIQNETVSQYLTSVNTKYTLAWVYNNTEATWTKGTHAQPGMARPGHVDLPERDGDSYPTIVPSQPHMKNVCNETCCALSNRCAAPNGQCSCSHAVASRLASPTDHAPIR